MVLASKLSHFDKKLAITFLSILFGLLTNAQQWEFVDSQLFELPVRMVNADRLGNIYVNDSKGNIRKLDSLGHPLSLYAPGQFGRLTALESWNSLRVFLFYENTQQYLFLDRYLAPSEFLEFPSDQFGFVRLASSSSDNQIWVLDIITLQLAKYDFNYNQVTLSQSLNQLSDTLALNPYQLVEYQNRVYLGDSKLGVLIFDNLGNYLRTLPKTGTAQFHLFEDKLYYLTDEHVLLHSIYSDKSETITLPDNELSYDHVLFVGNATALFSGKKMHLLHYNPR